MDIRNIDVVLIRMDKIGDLVVSLPVDEHPAFAGKRVHWLISSGLSFITDQAAPKRMATEFKRSFSPMEFWRMYRWLKKAKPQTAFLLHAPWWVSMALWCAGVPERIGRKSQWHSWLFLNLHVEQKRSQADRHESDFNFDLVEWGMSRLGLRPTEKLSALKQNYLRLVAPNPFGTLQSRGLQAKGYRIIHPGMAGSALNWPQKNFKDLIEQLAGELPVLVTGTSADSKYLNEIESVKDLPNVTWLVGSLRSSELLDLLSQAKSVIAPSTGVLHLAASLGTPVVGIYSPRKVEHPLRWGPRGLYVSYLLPEVEESTRKIKPEVMSKISTEDVLREIKSVENKSSATNSINTHATV